MKMQLISEMDKKLPIYNSAASISEKLSAIFESRFSKNSKLLGQDGTLLVYVFFNYVLKNNPAFKSHNQKLFIGKDPSLNNLTSLEAFFATSSCAIANEIVIPRDISSLAIYYSLSVIDKNSVLNIKEERPVFEAIVPKYSFDDVILNESEVRAIMRALMMIKYKDLAYETWGYRKVDPSTKSILCFHGEPGTGKTMCAHAVANYLGKKLLIARYSQIQSKYTGEGEKNLRAYFEAAEEQNAVLFIDEADTFLSKRLSSSNSNSKIYNSMSNELFQLIEDHNGCIIFASNHVTDFDPAFISRIIEPVEFLLPDKDTRVKIIKKLIPSKLPLESHFSNDDFSHLADVSEGFSGRDIRKAVFVSIADKLYVDRELGQKSENDLSFKLEDLIIGFENVREARNNLLESANNINQKVGEFLHKEETNKRMLQLAAITLWADNQISDKERLLFKELADQYKIPFPVDDKESLPTIPAICQKIKTRSEKLQAIDIVSRMIAYDGQYPQEEKAIIRELVTNLGFDHAEIPMIDSYIKNLITNYGVFESIAKKVEISPNDAYEELRKEYTEGAAYLRLAELYETGSTRFGGISPNEEMSEYYYEKAAKFGFKH